MGLGSKEPQRRIYYMSPRAQDKDKKLNPHFKVQVKEGGAYRDLPDENSVSGYLVGIGHGQYEYPKGSGDMNPTIKVMLVDGDDMFKIEANTQSNMIRSLMNTVIGTRDFDVMKISVYAKNDNPNIFISNNDQKTSWKYDYKKDIEPLIQVVPDPKKPGKTVKIYHKVDEMLMNDWKALEPYITERAKKKGWLDMATTDENKGQSLQAEFDSQAEPSFAGSERDQGPPPHTAEDDLPF